MKPLLLDLFCGAGGATRGYQTAGFKVHGVDNRPQPNYCGDGFLQANALDVLKRILNGDWYGEGYDAIHASPPCQAFSRAQKLQGNSHPELIYPLRELLKQTALPYIIENVVGAPLWTPIRLEGQMFPGLGTSRPRLFEMSWPVAQPGIPEAPKHTKMGRPPVEGEFMHVVGHFSNKRAAEDAMAIDWMTRDELKEAIPPAYTHYIGLHLQAHLLTWQWS